MNPEFGPKSTCSHQTNGSNRKAKQEVKVHILKGNTRIKLRKGCEEPLVQAAVPQESSSGAMLQVPAHGSPSLPRVSGRIAWQGSLFQEST